MAFTENHVAFDPHVFLTTAGAGRAIEKFRPHEVIYHQGDAGDAVYYQLTGNAKKTAASESGKEAVLAILEPGDFFGEGCLSGHPRRQITVTAMTDCTVMRVEKAVMARALGDDHVLCELFIAYLLKRNSRSEQDMADQLLNSSEKRLARTLLLLAKFGKEGTKVPVISKISQETLAEMVGTTRSRVSFFMNKFRRFGFIDYDGDNRGDLSVNVELLNTVLEENAPFEKVI